MDKTSKELISDNIVKIGYRLNALATFSEIQNVDEDFDAEMQKLEKILEYYKLHQAKCKIPNT